MVERSFKRMAWVVMVLALLAGCVMPAQPVFTVGPAPAATTGAETMAGSRLAARVLYPTEESVLTAGQTTRLIAQVTGLSDGEGDSRVTFAVSDATGREIATLEGIAGTDGVFRSEPWTLPKDMPAGASSVTVSVQTNSAEQSQGSRFQVDPSLEEVLLAKYGVWLDVLSFKGIVPQLFGEQGDAHNGLIRIGGTAPGQHILPEEWVDVQWRAGDFGLASPEAVRRFMMEQIGNLAPRPVREIAPFEPFKFKQWNAWRASGRGEYLQDQLEWVVFYAPEVDKTFAIGALAVQPPTGVDPHAMLRESFRVDPSIDSDAVAPEPLPRLLPAPETLSPSLGERFWGRGQPIVLQWKPVKELAEDEYYEVVVDYWYQEGNPTIRLNTRDTQVMVPDALYEAPNCRVFNWQVTLKRQTGVDKDGQPKGEAISFPSLYRYFWWLYPADEVAPYPVLCPYTHVE